jgi:hypothetical protein
MAIIAASIISAAAFTVGGAIYDQFRNSDAERHNKAMEKLNAETTKYNKEKQIVLEYINYQLKLQQDAISNFNDVDSALEKYNELFPENNIELREKPKLSDYYVASDEKINTEYVLIIGGGILAAYVAHKYF